MAAAKLSILIVEDSAFTRIGLRNYLEKQDYIVLEASNVADALHLFEENRPDIAILDISLPKRMGEQPDMDAGEGLQIALYIKKNRPEVGVILLSAYLSYYQKVHEIIRKYQGIAYLFKGDNPKNELLNVIEQVQKGGVWIAPEIASYKDYSVHVSFSDLEQEKIENVICYFNDLTNREKEVVQLLASSYDNEDIAKELCISLNTVSSHLTKIYSKVGLGENINKSKKRSLLTKAYLLSQTKNY